jgi:hypothetical protein
VFLVGVRITQHPLARAQAWSLTVIGAFGAGFVAVASWPVWLRTLLALLVVSTGLALAWRGSHQTLEVRDGTLTIHGWLRSHVIPVGRVVELSRTPYVAWENTDGRRRSALLWMLYADGQPGPVARHNKAALDRLARALHRKLTD